MTKILNLLIFTFFLACAINANSQVKVYKTYEEYSSGGGTEYDEFSDFDNVKGLVKFKKSSKETTYKCKKIWGFTTGEEIWRCTNYGGMGPSFVKLVMSNENSLYYYEYGVYHASLLLGRKWYEHTLVQCHVSASLNGEMVRVWLKGGMKKKLEEFGKNNPECNSLIQCWLKMETKNQCSIDQTKPCAIEYFGIEEE